MVEKEMDKNFMNKRWVQFKNTNSHKLWGFLLRRNDGTPIVEALHKKKLQLFFLFSIQ